jgi:hypothetical protein
MPIRTIFEKVWIGDTFPPFLSCVRIVTSVSASGSFAPCRSTLTVCLITKKEQVFNGTFKAKDQDIFDV